MTDAMAEYNALRNAAIAADGVKIAAVGDELMETSAIPRDAYLALHLKREHVVWQGPAAAEFDAWSQNLTTTMWLFAEYVYNQGKHLSDIGSEITTTISGFPELPPEFFTQRAAATDPASMAENDRLLGVAKDEARLQMQSLAQAYRDKSTLMDGVAKPVFQPAADLFKVGRDITFEDFGQQEGSSAAATVSASGQASVAGSRPSERSTVYGRGGAVPYGDTSPVHAGPSDLGQSNSAAAPGIVPTTPVGSNLAYVATPSPSLPSTAAPDTSLTSAVSTPPTNGPVPVMSSLPVGRDAGSRGGSSLPGGFGGSATVPGTSRSPGGGSITRRSEGVVGGTARPGRQAPGGQTGGFRSGMPVSGGVAGPSPTGGTGAAGRAPVARPGVPGGVVGGVPTSGRPGTRREFTSGGSGLRTRETPSAGSTGAAGTSHGRPVGGVPGGAAAGPPTGDRGRRERADYLTEDDEYWNGRRNDGVPPVIG